MSPLSRSHPARRFSILGAVLLAAAVTLRADPPKVIESPTVGTAGKPVLAITESDRTQTVEAEGRDVSVVGNGNKITVNGKCHALTVSGNDNVVHVRSVVSISTPGNANKVNYSQASGGESVQVTNVGKGNVVSKDPG